MAQKIEVNDEDHEHILATTPEHIHDKHRLKSRSRAKVHGLSEHEAELLYDTPWEIEERKRKEREAKNAT